MLCLSVAIQHAEWLLVKDDGGLQRRQLKLHQALRRQLVGDAEVAAVSTAHPNGCYSAILLNFERVGYSVARLMHFFNHQNNTLVLGVRRGPQLGNRSRAFYSAKKTQYSAERAIESAATISATTGCSHIGQQVGDTLRGTS